MESFNLFIKKEKEKEKRREEIEHTMKIIMRKIFGLKIKVKKILFRMEGARKMLKIL